jgi:DNA-binding PadR family transcriptional regulator
MSLRIYLGELEELILLLVALYNKEAYGVLLTEELQKQAGREISISAVHAVLHRLEEKGFVSSHLGGASAERGGRRKRLFSITGLGHKAIEELRDTRNQIWCRMAKSAPL